MAERAILVAVEDLATAGVVAAGAAHLAIDREADRVVLLHILDEHMVANGLFGLVGAPVPAYESKEESESILGLAEAAMRAEFAAMRKDAPTITCEVRDGRPAKTIGQVAAECGAAAIVVGARRPHAFGRLTHPNVADFLRGHTDVPVSVVALQADTREQSVESAAQ